MNETGKRIAEAAVSLIGTPYHDGGRVPGVGLDCAGLVIACYRAAGGTIDDHGGHTRGDQYVRLEKIVEKIATAVHVSPTLDGDLILFRWKQVHVHCGILVGNDIIHATNLPGAAGVARVENYLYTSWNDRIRGIWRFNEVVG